MRYLSLFSGRGGFELGIKQEHEQNLGNRGVAGASALELHKHLSHPDAGNGDGGRTDPMCVGFSEIDKYAVQIYQKHFPEHKNYGDITTINASELPDFDLLVGGFPCQAFSIAGKRGGFNDTRGTLFFEIARILATKEPRLFLLENVKGLLSHDGGRTFSTIISTIDELGYDLQWQVLNSKNFGVPQNRERVFIVGHLRGTSRPQVFPFGEANVGVDVRKSSLSGQIQAQGESPDSGHPNSEVSQNGENGHIHQLNQPTHSNDRVYGTGGVAPTLNTAQGGRRQPFIPSGAKIRRLTPLECERLQGFPDNWTEGLSDTQRYKTLGNAVTVNVIEAIMTKLLCDMK